MLADILPTAYEVGVLAGHVSPGDTVVIVGAGPIGLAAVHHRPALQPDPRHRRRPGRGAARRREARSAPTSPSARTEDVRRASVRSLTGGLGADVAIEAVGVPETFELCTALVRPGGHVANVGVHGAPATLHLEDLWIKDVTITTGLVDTRTTPQLLRHAGRPAGSTSPALVTHRFGLDEMQDGVRRVLAGRRDRRPEGRPVRGQRPDALTGADRRARMSGC